MRRYPAFFRRPGCLVALGMLVVIVIALWKLGEPEQLGCTDVVLDRLPSPDGAWVAVIDESHCEAEMGGDTIAAGVDLVSTKPPFQDIELLGVDTGGHNEERPHVAWSGPNMLRVTVGLYSYLKVLTRKAEGVQVEVHFDPDNPAARAAWLKETDQTPDSEDDTTKH